MKNSIKTILQSEKGMTMVNMLFLVSLLIRNRWISLFACMAWIAYLAYFIKGCTSKTARIIHGIFMAVAAGMILLNLYSMLQ